VAEETNIATPEADSGYGSPVDMDYSSQTRFSTKISAVINRISVTTVDGKRWVPAPTPHVCGQQSDVEHAVLYSSTRQGH